MTIKPSELIACLFQMKHFVHTDKKAGDLFDELKDLEDGKWEGIFDSLKKIQARFSELEKKEKILSNIGINK